MRTELKPCPFCNSREIAVKIWDRMTYHVRCDACDAHGPLAFSEAGNARKGAAEAWNYRPRAATAERKRREECEAVLREVAGAPNRIAENSRIIADYFGEGKSE